MSLQGTPERSFVAECLYFLWNICVQDKHVHFPGSFFIHVQAYVCIHCNISVQIQAKTRTKCQFWKNQIFKKKGELMQLLLTETMLMSTLFCFSYQNAVTRMNFAYELFIERYSTCQSSVFEGVF